MTHRTQTNVLRENSGFNEIQNDLMHVRTYKIVWQQLYVHRLVIKQQHGDLFSSLALVSILFIQISTLIGPRHSYQNGTLELLTGRVNEAAFEREG